MKKYKKEMLDDLLQITEIDKAERENVLCKAIGYLSIEDFSKKCGCSTSELYDSLYGSEPMTKELIWKISNSSELFTCDKRFDYDEADITFEHLINENGMCFKADLEAIEEYSDYVKTIHDPKVIYKYRNDVRRMKNTILDAINSRDESGSMIYPFDYIPELRIAASLSQITVFQFMYSRPHYHAYTFFVPKGRYIGNYPYPHTAYSVIEDMERPYVYDEIVTQEIQELFSREAGYILLDINNPGMFRNVARSYVFDDATLFEAFWELISQFDVNSDISVVLTEDGEVKREEFLYRKDNTLPESVLLQ